MKIDKKKNYKIKLYEEEIPLKDHKKSRIEDLEFNGNELIDAIISTGMPDVYLTKLVKKKRKDEILIKKKIFETYVTVNSENELQIDKLMKKYLDKSEVAAINYWIGMFVTTLIGKKKYKYDFMVHLSMLDFFSTRINLKKRSYFNKNGSIVFKQPDLIAINIKNNTYGVFESKGYSSYDSKEMERAYSQAKSIKKINGTTPKNRFVVMTETGKEAFKTILKDPKGEGVDLIIDPNFACLFHYSPIVELLQELNGEKKDGRITAYLEDDGFSYKISLAECMYEYVLKESEHLSHLMNEKNSSYTEEIREYEIKSDIVGKLKELKNILLVE